jgi:glycosyltransferase involved in cell wall biosynthesis
MVYNLASVSVYPTRYEGFGFPALEALACGVPLITTAVSSLPEIVGEAGLLIPAQDEQALAQALYRLVTDQGLRLEYEKKGPEQAAQFTWEHTAEQTLRVYRRVLGKV